MPDKKYDELSDKGWVGMVAALDKEMPVKKDRRWMLLLLLLMSMGAIAASLVYWNTTDDKTAVFADKDNLNGQQAIDKDEIISENAIINSKVAPIIKTESPTTTTETFTSKLNNIRETPSQSLNEESSGTSSEISNIEDEKIKINRVTEETISDGIVKEELKEDNTVVASSSNLATSVGNQSDLATNKVAEISSETQPKLDKGDRGVIAYSKLLPLMPLDFSISIVELQSTRKSFENPVLRIQSVRRPISLRIYSGIALPITTSSKGLFAGASIEKGLNHRWKIAAGLGMLMRYNSSPQVLAGRLAFNVQDPVGLTDVDENTVQEGIVFATNDYEVRQEYYGIVSDKLSRSTYIELPIEVKYKVSQRHEVGIGMRYGYLLSAKNDRIYLAEFESSLSTSAGFLSTRALSNANVINRHNASITSSYRFALTKRIGLNANLNIGLNDIIRTNGISDADNRLNYVGLGVDYRLKM